MRHAISVTAAASGIILLALGLFGDPASYLRDASLGWQSPYPAVAPADGAADPMASSRMAALQNEVAKLRQELAERAQPVGSDASSGKAARTAQLPAGRQAANQPSGPARTALRASPAAGAPETATAAAATAPAVKTAPPSQPEPVRQAETGRTKVAVGKGVELLPPKAPIEMVDLPPPEPAARAAERTSPARDEAASIALKPAKVRDPGRGVTRAGTGPEHASTNAADDTDNAEAVLARLRQSLPPESQSVTRQSTQLADASPGAPAEDDSSGDTPTLPAPTLPAPALPAANAPIGRLRAALADLSAGRVEEARQQLQRAQLYLVFRPGGTDSGFEDSAAAVGGALGALGQNDVRLSLSFIDRALSDLVRGPDSTPLPGPSRAVAGGYAPAYPPAYPPH